MDVDEVLLTGLDRFQGVLQNLTPENGTLESPCNQWDARSVAGHMLTVLDSAAVTLRGENFDWGAAPEPHAVGGDDPLQVFIQRAAAARLALSEADLDDAVVTPMGAMTIGQRLSFPAMDLHLHAWDLGQAIGIGVTLPEEVAEFVHRVLDPLPESMTRSEGVFGPAVEPPADATSTQVLMAWTGRQVS